MSFHIRPLKTPEDCALAYADLLDDVGAGRLTPDEAQTISAIVAKRAGRSAPVHRLGQSPDPAHRDDQLAAHDREYWADETVLGAAIAGCSRDRGEGLIAELVRVEKEGGRISSQEMVAMVFLLLGAGSETTTASDQRISL